jgi:hypothetical protein
MSTFEIVAEERRPSNQASDSRRLSLTVTLDWYPADHKVADFLAKLRGEIEHSFGFYPQNVSVREAPE